MARPSASERARRLLSILHLMQRDTRIPLESVAAASGTTLDEVTRDIETLSVCGIAPYSPNELVPLYIEDGCVVVWGELPALSQTVRLSHPEAQALATALQAAGMNADDPLVGRLLSAAAPADLSADEIERHIRASSVPSESPDTLKVLALALQEGRVVRISYHGAGRSEDTERDIEPLGLTSERGAWYVEAWCRSANGPRTFRVDRVRRAQALDEMFPPRDDVAASGTAFAGRDLPMARIELAPREAFLRREWPGAVVVESGGPDSPTVIDVPYSGEAWIARQVLARLGGARVLAPEEVRAAVHALAAGR